MTARDDGWNVPLFAPLARAALARQQMAETFARCDAEMMAIALGSLPSPESGSMALARVCREVQLLALHAGPQTTKAPVAPRRGAGARGDVMAEDHNRYVTRDDNAYPLCEWASALWFDELWTWRMPRAAHLPTLFCNDGSTSLRSLRLLRPLRGGFCERTVQA